jgi:uncharacterized protein (DUF1015 family)
MPVLPFKAFRYNPEIINPDVVYLPPGDFSSAGIEKYLTIPYHSANILNPYAINNKVINLIFQEWVKKKVLIQELNPVFYSYRQSWNSAQGPRSRTGLICLLPVFPENPLIKEHEAVIEWHVEKIRQSIEERPVTGNFAMLLYKNKTGVIDAVLEESLVSPMFQVEEQCVHTFGKIDSPAAISPIVEFFATRLLYLADGHHRYNALRRIAKENGNQSFMLSVLYNIEDDPVEIYPFHRLYDGDFEEEIFLEKLEEYFKIRRISEISAINQSRGTFGLVLKNKLLEITLRPGKSRQITWNFPEIIKNLDQTVVHYFIFWKCLGVKGSDQKNSKNIKFCTIFADCAEKVDRGEAKLAIIMNEVGLSQILDVAESGYRYPQKTSFFYPKTLSGLLFASAITGVLN